MPTDAPGGALRLSEDLTLSRMGFGAMQLAGPHVFGPPRDRPEAIAVLRTAVDLGITHIDTSDFYGPYTVNEVIREALHPYPPGVHVVTKVGARRGPDGSWYPALDPAELRTQVDGNLERLGVDVLDVVNLRLPAEGISDDSVAESFGALADLQRDGLIRHLGVSEVSSSQLDVAQHIATVVTVQNLYNVANRKDDDLVARCERDGIAFAPYFSLGGFTPLQSDGLDAVAAGMAVSSQQVALAWLLQRSSTITVIPGTSSVDHLRDNVAAADLVLPADAIAQLDAIGVA